MDPEWKRYLNGRYDGDPEFELARRLLKRSYSLSELPPVLIPPEQQSDMHQRQMARYKAEWKYFNCSERRRDVKLLLAQIVDQRYRRTSETGTTVNLVGVPVRRLIAAERLYHQKLIKLSGHSENDPQVILVGLDVNELKQGPRERYSVKSALDDDNYTITCTHRSEGTRFETTSHPARLGHKFVSNVDNYKHIVKMLRTLFLDCSDINVNRLMCRMFREFCQGHCLTESSLEKIARGRRSQQLTGAIRRFLRLCFLFLSLEQSQIQSAFFLSGETLKLGMAVSFARLVRLFKDNHITLEDLFINYRLYSNKLLMKEKKLEVCRRNCEKIDMLYQRTYGRRLDESQALKDLSYLYGNYDVDDLEIQDLGVSLNALLIRDHDD